MPGLDGLRALAVFAVIAYHLNSAWAPGGLLGVCLFFVLSGYLITDLLVVEWSNTGRIDLKNFWLRRARRLLPALFVMLLGVIAWTGLFSPGQLKSLGEDVLAALLYVSNWWLVFHKVSYFASFGPPSPLGHLWSLAVEEQFYLFWPLLLWLGLRYLPRRGYLLGMTILGVLASAAAMTLIYQPGTDPSRVYYGTDTRAFALLIGAALALVWPSRRLSKELSRGSRLALDVMGGAGLFAVLLMFWQTNEYDAFLYPRGLLLFSLASAVLVAVLAHPASRLGKVFGKQPWRGLGMCSYGIYLWHYPIIVWTSPAINTNGTDILLALSQVLASIFLAVLSWLFIEEPIRRGVWKRSRRGRENSKGQGVLVSVSGRVTLVSALLVLGIACLVILGGFFLANQKQNKSPASDPNTSSLTEIQPGQAGSGSAVEPEFPVSASGSDSEASEDPEDEGVGSGNMGEETPLVQDKPANTTSASSESESNNTEHTAGLDKGAGISVIGDSVMVDAKPVLQELLPGIVIDGKIGRQLYQAPEIVAQLKANGDLGSRVIIELGTNGPFTEKQLKDLLASLGNVEQIYLVNTRVPRSWEGVVNQTLAQVAADYPKTTLVDWYSASSGHNEYFYADGVHLNSAGSQAYGALIAKALESH
nr:acyltransferase family protein [Desulfosporosinus orientis]